MLFAVLTALLVSTAPGSLLEQARNAERELEYQSAKHILVELFSAPGVSEPDLIEGHLLAGGIERVLENDTEARLHFLYVLHRRPDHVLGDEVPPKVRNFFELVREEVRNEQKQQPVIVPPPPPPPEKSLLGPLVSGVGGVVTAVGVIAVAIGETTFAQTSETFEERAAGRDLALAGWAVTGVGVVVVVVGAVLIVGE